MLCTKSTYKKATPIEARISTNHGVPWAIYKYERTLYILAHKEI